MRRKTSDFPDSKFFSDVPGSEGTQGRVMITRRDRGDGVTLSFQDRCTLVLRRIVGLDVLFGPFDGHRSVGISVAFTEHR